ncbi:MAG: sialate O-acetylesterase [Planctomycetes bacterium]|nr:sialate O-acetylesterase [Planctomycetota bacterium]MBL7044231.1 sialate O-acetylesterase [Pirellulaceae bacterium]
MKSRIRILVALVLGILMLVTTGRADEKPAAVKVFILAGQANMEGQGVVGLDHPKYYNGGRGTLQQIIRGAGKAETYKHIQDSEGRWIVRDDVWCRFRTSREVKKGPLTIGFAGYPGAHHIGPEFQFGHVIGDAVDAPVLLIKTAWGGKSLHKDFRPPSSGGETGPYYTRMLLEVRETLGNLGADFPELAGRSVEIVGFVWFQGWNDAVGPDEARNEYERNLVNLIKDVRKALDCPNLSVVIGELGNGGEKASPRILAIRKAQSAAVACPDFKDRVVFVKTTAFARPADESPNTGHGHHWFGNAESYFLIGDALGKAMKELLCEAP